MNTYTTSNMTFICPECKNETTLAKDKKVGDIVECEFCGIELEVIEVTAEGEYVLQILEEEK